MRSASKTTLGPTPGDVSKSSEAESGAEMKVGDRVQLRPPLEILSTLDPSGCLSGQPFMPEMLEYYGRSFRVSALATRVCDTATGWPGVRHLDKTVLLEDLRCSGKAHGGCQAQCRLYWRTEWLGPADPSEDTVDFLPADLEQLERFVRDHTKQDDSPRDEPLYRCQATELPRSSEIVSQWDARSLLSEAVNGNVTKWSYARISIRLVLEEIARRLRLPIETVFPFKQSKLSENIPSATTPAESSLAPGDLVRVRSREEILRTLGPNGKNRGLWFDREMLPFCGKTSRIQTKVERFIDEPTGRFVELKSDCYILEGFVCSGELSARRWFCCRQIYPWWRACWLEKIADTAAREPDGSAVHPAMDPTAGPLPPSS